MVVIHVKHNDQSLFLFETATNQTIAELINDLCGIYNELQDLAAYGISLPEHMQGIAPEKFKELNLCDEYESICIPTGGHISNPDPSLKRNGFAPNPKMVELIQRTIQDAKSKVDQKLVEANISVKYSDVQDALDQLKGLTMIVYPMGLPPYDPVKMELDGKENTCTKVIPANEACLWFSGKEMSREKRISDYTGKNEKTKIVVKIQKKGLGAPPREPPMSEADQRNLTAFFYKKQQEYKKMEEEDDDYSYLNSEWADNENLKKSIHGIGGIKWK